jgi:hypothetical protein
MIVCATLSLFLSFAYRFADPEQVRAQCDHTTLIWFLEQLSAILSGLGDEGIVVFFGEITALQQGSYHGTERPYLSLGVGHFIFIQDGCLLERRYI